METGIDIFSFGERQLLQAAARHEGTALMTVLGEASNEQRRERCEDEYKKRRDYHRQHAARAAEGERIVALARFVRTCVPERVATLRVLARLAPQGSALTDLRRICSHPLVLRYAGFHACFWMTNTDSRIGHSGCVVCGARAADTGDRDVVDAVWPQKAGERAFLDMAKVGGWDRDVHDYTPGEFGRRLAMFEALDDVRDVQRLFFSPHEAALHAALPTAG